MSRTVYALWGEQSQSWITRGGKVIAHTDRGELEFLFPNTLVKPLFGIPEDDVLWVRDLPEFAHVTWPLKREEFW